MWNLKKGRNKFLDRHRFDHKHSVWWYVSRALYTNASDAQREAVQRDLLTYERKHSEHLHWEPTWSNCPVYAAIVEDVRSKLPPQWRALAKNIFVGVILNPEVNARAWNHHDAGVVEVSLQYLWALEAYASAFDEFAYALSIKLNRTIEEHFPKSGKAAIQDDYGNLRKLWLRLDSGAEDWRRLDAVAAGSLDLVRVRPGRRQRDFDRYQEVAQEFIVCHEIAHHVLTHTATSARRREREARKLIEPLLRNLDIDSAAELSRASVHEIEADLVAVAIMMGYFEEGVTKAKAYRAIGGSILALVTATHVNEHWLLNDSNDDHPPLSVRLRFMFAAFSEWFAELSPGDKGDHPLDYALQWRIFVECLMTHWLEGRHQIIAERNRQLSDDQYTDLVATRFLDGWLVLREPLQEHGVDGTAPSANHSSTKNEE